MAGSIKIARLQELIRYKIAIVVQRDLADPRLGLVTITKVKLASDLSTAQVYFSVLGPEGARSKCQHALEHSRGYIQREVARALKTRTTPHIAFHYDESIEGSVRISAKLREVLPEAMEGSTTTEDSDPTHTDDELNDGP